MIPGLMRFFKKPVTLFLLNIFSYLSLDACVTARRDFFQELTGITEVEFLADEAALLPRILRNGKIYNLKNNDVFNAGRFHPYSINELDLLVEGKKKSAVAGKFNVTIGYNTRHMSFERKAALDIQALQANPTNKNALFQVASNFDCLENASAAAEGPHFLSEYPYDMTQGPFASISAVPGLFLRRYGMGPVNLLETFPFIPMRRGYPQFCAMNNEARRRAAEELDYRNIKVGVHTDVDVVYGQLINAEKHMRCLDKDQKISQVYVSALDFGNQSGNGLKDLLARSDRSRVNSKNREYAEIFAKKLLLAAYEGTIKAAIAFGNQKVFLSLIGCGVFANRLEWVYEAIESCIEDIVAFGLDVTLIVYDAHAREDLPCFCEKVKKIAVQTGGVATELYEACGFMGSALRGRLN